MDKVLTTYEGDEVFIDRDYWIDHNAEIVTMIIRVGPRLEWEINLTRQQADQLGDALKEKADG